MKKHTTLKSKFNSAFSLVELLVVIAVIAVIAAIAIPNITGTREAAVEARNAANTAAVDRANAQLSSLGDTDAPYTLTDFQAPGGVVYVIPDPDLDGPATARTVTFKLD
jgi:type IV pilus assembly protein PilA